MGKQKVEQILFSLTETSDHSKCLLARNSHTYYCWLHSYRRRIPTPWNRGDAGRGREFNICFHKGFQFPCNFFASSFATFGTAGCTRPTATGARLWVSSFPLHSPAVCRRKLQRVSGLLPYLNASSGLHKHRIRHSMRSMKVPPCFITSPGRLYHVLARGWPE